MKQTGMADSRDGNRLYLYEKFQNPMDSMLEFMWADDSCDCSQFIKMMRIQDNYRKQDFEQLYQK